MSGRQGGRVAEPGTAATVTGPVVNGVPVVNRVAVVNHVGLTVADLDRSVGFYRDVVGMAVLHRGDRAVGGEWFDTLTGSAGARVKSVLLAASGLTLQLVHYEVGGMSRARLDHAAPGTPHLCIAVADVAERHAVATAAGFTPTSIVTHELITGRSFYVDDPDGVPVEFLQHTPGSEAERALVANRDLVGNTEGEC